MLAPTVTLVPAPFTAWGHTYAASDVVVDGTVVGQVTRSANGCFAMGRVQGGEWCSHNHGRTEDALRCATR